MAGLEFFTRQDVRGLDTPTPINGTELTFPSTGVPSP
jgi:hypothetical protein